MTWTSTAGLVLRDRVPAALRRHWVAAGHCPDRDLYSLFAVHVRAHPDRPAIIDPAGTTDYRTLDLAARSLAGVLAAQGIGPHDIVAIRVPDTRDAAVAELAVAAIGAVALPFLATGPRDTTNILTRSSATALITITPPAAPPATGSPPAADPPGGAGPPWLRVVVAPTARGEPVEPREVDAEAPARILVSSGSEAEPKLVAYSHNAMAGGRGNYLAAVHGGRPADARDLLLVPLASAFGSFGVVVTVATHGATLLLPGRFDPATALRMLDEHRATHLFGVPTMLARMAAMPRAATETAPVAVVASGAALSPATAAACRDRWGCPVIEVYGSADGVNCHSADPPDRRPDPAVAELRLGEDGEIQALGPMSPLCYVGAPELDARYRLPGGWVRTGDRGEFDADGRLRVTGRIRQVVIRGGYTISPAEVEGQLGAHPAVADAACVPVPDPELGERLCACVAPRPGLATPTLGALNTFLERDRGLERRKLPELLVVLPELPLGPTGKVCRRTLTALAAAHGVNGGPA